MSQVTAIFVGASALIGLEVSVVGGDSRILTAIFIAILASIFHGVIDEKSAS